MTATDLAGWFAAQLDADEQTARAAQEAADGLAGSGELWVVTGADNAVGVDYDPAFVLADITAKRELARLHGPQRFRREWPVRRPDVQLCPACSWQPPYPCQTLRLLAAPYAGRPGYDTAWAPEQPAHNTAGGTT